MSIQQPNERRAFHVNDAIKIYGLSRATIYKMINAGELRTVKLGGRRLIPRDAIEALLAGGAK